MVKKATKKFNKHHLAPELQRRKVANKIKSAQEQKQKKLELKVAGGKASSKNDKGNYIDEEEEGGGLGEWKKKGFFDEDIQVGVGDELSFGVEALLLFCAMLSTLLTLLVRIVMVPMVVGMMTKAAAAAPMAMMLPLAARRWRRAMKMRTATCANSTRK
jgi:hypothetical protein